MRVEVIHALPGRLRFRVDGPHTAASVHEAMERSLAVSDPHFRLSYNARTRRFLLVGDRESACAEVVQKALEKPELRLRALPDPEDGDGQPDAMLQDEVQASALRIIVPRVAEFLLIRTLTPRWLKPLATAIAVRPFLQEGVRDLRDRKLSVPVLDATAIVSSIVQRDLATASTIAFLLDLGEELEEWTREKVRHNLAEMFRGDTGPVWVKRNGKPVQIPADQVKIGDRVVVHAGARIPVDGVVLEGEAMVDQSSMTGESQAVRRRPGLSVYAGTTVAEGELLVTAKRVGAETRFANIAQVIEDAERRNTRLIGEAQQLAEAAVPFTFLVSAVAYAMTRDWRRAASVLVVDYSCALKLATPLAVKSAMLEAASRGALVKGGQYLEVLGRTNTFVFDKTGTLTAASPRVSGVHGVNGFDRDFVLRNAACLEEHFPHPVATAIVKQAEEEKLDHEEKHAEVKYIVAHGIASSLDGQRIIVGSRHFVEEDEEVDVSAGEDLCNQAAARGHNSLYFAVDGTLAGIITIEDPPLPEAPAMVEALKRGGRREIIMLTGDNPRSARHVARGLGIDRVHAEMLPDEKARLLDQLQEDGRIVAMVGDGVNDSAALAVADVGISVESGAGIARAAADILLLGGRLQPLPDTVEISRRMVGRIRTVAGVTIAANTVFMGLGLFGLASPALLAFLHNASTVGACTWNMRPLLGPPEE